MKHDENKVSLDVQTEHHTGTANAPAGASGALASDAFASGNAGFNSTGRADPVENFVMQLAQRYLEGGHHDADGSDWQRGEPVRPLHVECVLSKPGWFSRG